MTSFSSNKISFDSETIAKQLRQARQAKKVSLEAAAKQLQIRIDYLRALEAGDYGKLPVGVYGKNYLREYCQYLSLDYGGLLELYESEKEQAFRDERPVFAQQVVKKRDLWAMPKIFRNLAITILLLAFFLYFGFYLKRMTALPYLELSNPPDNLITDQSAVNVIGTAEKETKVTINGESVFVDSGGYFSKIINLKKGINTITIEAKKKFGRSNEITRQILVKDSEKKAN